MALIEQLEDELARGAQCRGGRRQLHERRQDRRGARGAGARTPRAAGPAFAADLARRHDPHHAPGYWRDLLRWLIAANTAAPAYAVDDLRRIRVPTLWIAGEDDPWFELDQPLAMKRHIPGAELLIVNHAGHGPQQTHPHLVGPAIAAFLTRSDARQHP